MIWALGQHIINAGVGHLAEDVQQMVEDAQSTAPSTVKSHASDLASINQKIDKLSLCCQAMWELLRDHSDLTEEDIDAKVIEIDNRDGKSDGTISAQMIYCSSCGRPSNTNRSNCVICGAELNKPHKFDV
jgi:hypothetical protein